MGMAHAVAFDPVDPARGRVEQHVDEVIVEEVDLVDVEDPPVRPCEQTGIERVFAVERLGDRQRPDDAIAGRPQRERDQRHRPLRCRWILARAAVLALGGGIVGRTAVHTVRDGRLGGEMLRQRPHCGGFRGALLAPNQQAIERVVRRDRQQRLLEVVLPDDPLERRRGRGPPNVGSGP